MKLYDGGKIIIGLLIFVGIATFPFYYNIGKVNAKPEPKVDTPAIQEWEKQYGKKECVEPKEFMRTDHMQLVNLWRDSVVRSMNREYISTASHKKFNMSLQNGCMHCHSNKKKFCDECHNYMAVKPFCWDCHIQPQEKEESKS
ncbi:MAG TPA: sulfate reduction electron transfer complex DsrMKJOP subunit DsrJ [Nitrospirota bacterium]|nr:sulfate reduction electron transfer complex DsrMKJOP subunit DsrJ [Nitrospirota bacterium]